MPSPEGIVSVSAEGEQRARGSTVFVDTLCVASLLRIVRFNRSVRRIQCFDPPSAAARKWCTFLRNLGLFHARIGLVKKRIDECRDSQGNNGKVSVRQGAQRIWEECRRDLLAPNSWTRTTFG